MWWTQTRTSFLCGPLALLIVTVWLCVRVIALDLPGEQQSSTTAF